MRQRDLWYSAMTEHVGPPYSRLMDRIAVGVAPDLRSRKSISIGSLDHRESSCTTAGAHLGLVVAEQPFLRAFAIELYLVAVTDADFGEGEKWVDVAKWSTASARRIYSHEQIPEEDVLPCTLVLWWLDERRMD